MFIELEDKDLSYIGVSIKSETVGQIIELAVLSNNHFEKVIEDAIEFLYNDCSLHNFENSVETNYGVYYDRPHRNQ